MAELEKLLKNGHKELDGMEGSVGDFEPGGIGRFLIDICSVCKNR